MAVMIMATKGADHGPGGSNGGSKSDVEPFRTVAPRTPSVRFLAWGQGGSSTLTGNCAGASWRSGRSRGCGGVASNREHEVIRVGALQLTGISAKRRMA